jgi:hypothetical protein
VFSSLLALARAWFGGHGCQYGSLEEDDAASQRRRATERRNHAAGHIRFLSFDHHHRSCSHALIGWIAFLPPFLPPGKTVPGAVGLRAGSGSAFPDVKPSIMASHPSTRTPTPSLLVGGSTRSGTIWRRRLPSPPTTISPAAYPAYSTTPFPLLVPPQDWIGFWLDVPIRPCALPQARILWPLASRCEFLALLCSSCFAQSIPWCIPQLRLGLPWVVRTLHLRRCPLFPLLRAELPFLGSAVTTSASCLNGSNYPRLAGPLVVFPACRSTGH